MTLAASRKRHTGVTAVILAAAALLAFALATPASAEHRESHFVEKFVNAVNGESVTDPNLGAGAEFVEVQTGDLVQFRIRLTNQTEPTVTIRDVYKFNQFEFVSSEEGECGDPADVGSDDNAIECSVDVSETGANFLLTFRVISEAPEGEGCATITNTAHVEVGSGGDESSDVAQVQVCGADATPTPTADAEPAEDTPTPAPTMLPDASMGPGAGAISSTGLLVLLGGLLLVSGASYAVTSARR